METFKPLVFKKDGKQRVGKGFSLDELKAVGLNPKQALKLGIPIDTRRKTAHEENIEMLRKALEAKKEAGKSEQEKMNNKEKTRKGEKGKK